MSVSPNDPSVLKQVQAITGLPPQACTMFRLTACNAMCINQEFNATAQLDRTPGGPDSIRGASIYGGRVSNDDNPMFCEGTVGQPMDDPYGISLPLPFTLSTSAQGVTMSEPTDILVVVLITWGNSEQDVQTCVLWNVIPVNPTSDVGQPH